MDAFEKEKNLEENSRSLHSILKSKIHAIDLALYSLKRNLVKKEVLLELQNISDATSTSLSIIDKLGKDLPSPTLYTLGFIAALQELAAIKDLTLHLDSIDEPKSFPMESVPAASLYRLIGFWIDESTTKFKAKTLHIDLFWDEKRWRVLYKDDGQYQDWEKPEDDAHKLDILELIQPENHLMAYSESGRTIILSGHC